jgi:bifunctional pyridoxal-dependent enzyme with beta-cystathionase and maltose regulon repressor activities
MGLPSINVNVEELPKDVNAKALRYVARLGDFKLSEVIKAYETERHSGEPEYVLPGGKRVVTFTMRRGVCMKAEAVDTFPGSREGSTIRMPVYEPFYKHRHDKGNDS